MLLQGKTSVLIKTVRKPRAQSFAIPNVFGKGGHGSLDLEIEGMMEFGEMSVFGIHG